MRIISGKYKGRIIHMSRGIRPTQDKVRKALFDILGDIEGLTFLELFAGSGAVGLEAVSRGISELTLVENNRVCLEAIKRNIESLKLESCRLYPGHAEDALKFFQEKTKRFQIVFLDPPYHQGLAKKILQILGAYDILAPNGFVVVQHFKKDGLPDREGNLIKLKEASYGDTFLSFYQKVTEDVPKSNISG